MPALAPRLFAVTEGKTSKPLFDPWYQHAACKDADTNLFFPQRGEKILTAAMALCAVCEVKAECLQYALDAGERIGVYGGTTGADRRRLRAIGGVSRVRR